MEEVILRIQRSNAIPPRQQKAWNEFLDMLVERAEAEINNEAESVSHQLTGSAEGGEV